MYIMKDKAGRGTGLDGQQGILKLICYNVSNYCPTIFEIFFDNLEVASKYGRMIYPCIWQA